MQIYYSPRFKRQYKKLSKEIQTRAEAKEQIFRQNPFDSRLMTHKLSGVMDGLWAFWVDHRNRIAFEFQAGDIVHFHKIGDHDIYE